MSTATSSAIALVFVTVLVVMLALMLIAVFRLPEWQPSTPDGGGRPLLQPVPAQAGPVPAGPVPAGPSLFQAVAPQAPAEPSRLPRRAPAASWAAVPGQPAGAAPLGPGEAIPLGEHGRLGEAALLGEAGTRPGDPSYAARRDREPLEQATVGRVVASGSPPWGPAPKPPGIP